MDMTIPYAFPAQIAATEAAETGKDRAGMYFAVQGLINQFVGSLAGSVLALLLTWEYGVVVVAPVAAVFCIAAFFFFAPYPLGKPGGVIDAADFLFNKWGKMGVLPSTKKRLEAYDVR